MRCPQSPRTVSKKRLYCISRRGRTGKWEERVCEKTNETRVHGPSLGTLLVIEESAQDKERVSTHGTDIFRPDIPIALRTPSFPMYHFPSLLPMVWPLFIFKFQVREWKVSFSVHLFKGCLYMNICAFWSLQTSIFNFSFSYKSFYSYHSINQLQL